MDAQRYRRLAGLLDAALELAPHERARLLERVAREEPDLHRDLAAALDADASAQPALDDRLVTSPGNDRGLPAAGTCIGPYRLRERLGRGGMGEVWLAERVDGQFAQTVALKLIRPGFDSAAVRARFRRERQILASLAHPHIAHLLDGGLTETGQPWFALEYIEGEPLTTHAARLPLGARLRLFVSVCRAVQFAHARLVIHRDLKPGNLLVGADGAPKLLDFGIATVLAGDDDTTTTLTRLTGTAATPEYAAPEQLAGQPATTATDVHALGLILFELLSGSRAARHPDAPARPSAAVPERRRRRALRGDLDTIVQRAVAAEPERRYASVEALADDIERHLGGLPVRARPDSRGYRAVKFARRHWAGLGATVVLMLSLCAGLAGTAWQAQRAQRQTTRAEAVKTFLVDLFSSNDPDAESQHDLSARELLDRGLERINASLREQPSTRADLLHTLARVASSLGLHDKGLALVEQAIAIRRTTLDADDPELIESLALRASILSELREYDAAISQLVQACALTARRFGDASDALATCRRRLGNTLDLDGRYDEAAPMLEAALGYLRAHADAAPLELAATLDDLASLRHSQGRFADAEPLAREAVSRYRGIALPRALGGLANALVTLTYVLRDQGNLAAAEACIREAIAIDSARLPPDHPLTLIARGELANVLSLQTRFDAARDEYLHLLVAYRSAAAPDRMSIAATLNSLGAQERDQQHYPAAAAYFREAIDTYVEQVGTDHPYAAIARASLARVLIRQRQPDQASHLLAAALAAYRGASMLSSPVAGVALLGMAELELARDQPAAAADWAERTLALWRPAFGARDWRVGRAELVLGEALIASGDRDAARDHLGAAVTALETQGYDREAQTAHARVLLAQLARIERAATATLPRLQAGDRDPAR